MVKLLEVFSTSPRVVIPGKNNGYNLCAKISGAIRGEGANGKAGPCLN